MRNGHVQISRESGLDVLGGEESLLRREILHRLLYEIVYILLKVVRKFHRVLRKPTAPLNDDEIFRSLEECMDAISAIGRARAAGQREDES
jgi:hypothetical protein